MVDVKAPVLPSFPDDAERHVAALAGRLLERVRQALAGQDRGGLRTSHFRVLSCVPADGSTITELSGPLFMTKQAVGQFVNHLEQSGHLEVRTDGRDRRRRVVVRTDLGDRTITAVNADIRALERQWAKLVGPESYRVFRGVLEQIALE